MGLSNKRQSDLEWALGIGMTKFYRSSFGAMLERQWVKYVNPPKGQPRGGECPRNFRTALCQGRQEDGTFAAVTALPSGCDESTRLGKRDAYTGRGDEHEETFVPMSLMHVAAEKRREGAYEPEFQDLHRFGEVSSALYKIEKVSPSLVSVLMAYHGDRGSRWAAERPGEGRLLAVYPITNTGSRWVESMRSRDAAGAFNLLRDDERLAAEAMAQEHQPNDLRRARLKRIEDEARTLLRLAHDTYKAMVEA